MAKKSEVKLLGTWASGYCTRVHLALKLKGIPYEYVEEDLSVKSELLLESNPVHKKVPVLLHCNKTVVESLIILEYIDECWSDGYPKLLPDDPYQRAKIRFWAKFYDEKILPLMYKVGMSKGEDQKRAIEEFSKMLSVFDQGIETDFSEMSLFNGDTLGFLDIVVGSISCNYMAFHEAIAVISDPNQQPMLFKWVNALKEHALMKETLPPNDKLVAKLKELFP